MTIIRLVSVLLIIIGGYLIRLSYTAFVKWNEYIDLGDPSGAEVYEIEFWLEAPLGFGMLVVGVFLLGRSISRI